MLIHSQFREGPALDYLQFEDERISISDKVTSLGHITFDDVIDYVCKSSVNYFWNFFRIRRYLLKNVASKIIHVTK